MKTVFITGAAGGIGKQAALNFAKNNWVVIATDINDDSIDEFQNFSTIYYYKLDVTSTESIEKTIILILKHHPKINTVINNAGMGYRSFVELCEDEKINKIVNVNWLGVVKICRAFIPTFRQQKFGQFINITSVAGLVNLPLGNFYHSTKQAVESFSECMAYELVDFVISVSTVQFGNAPTNFQKNVAKSANLENTSYNKLMDKISALLERKSCKNIKLPKQIAEKLYVIAENPNKNFRRYTIGFDANFMKLLIRILGYKLFNFVVRKFAFSKFQ